MIPLIFLPAAVLLYWARQELMAKDPVDRNLFGVAFLGLAALQMIMIGTRFGYGLEEIILVQPLTASMIPPLAYLAFVNPLSGHRKTHWNLTVHLIPLAVSVIVVMWHSWFIDLFLGASGLFYSGLLIRLGWQGQDGLRWTELNASKQVFIGLWAVIVLIVFSGLTDLVIGYDFLKHNGQNLKTIIGWTPAISIALARIFHKGPEFSANLSKQIGQSPAEA